MKVRNCTDKIRILSRPAGNITLIPNIWTDVPFQDAIRLHQQKAVDLETTGDINDYLWKQDGSIHLLWMSPFAIDDGYASAAEQYVLGLLDVGVQVYPQSCWWSVTAGLDKRTVKLLSRGVPMPLRVGLCMATPTTFPELLTPYKIGITMYESSQPLKYRSDWRAGANSVDMLIVPSDYCKEIFSPFFKRRIEVVPIIINPFYYRPVQRQAKPTFTFAMHGTLTGRKSPLEALDCFLKAFPRDKYPDVRLEFKTRLNILGQGEGRIPAMKDDRVSVFNGTWSIQQMYDWLCRSDAYLFPTKGEGYGMPPREAMATGLPTLFTNCSGLKELANTKYNYPIPVKRYEDCPLGGEWAIPDMDYCIETMRWMYHNRDAAYKKGAAGAVWLQRAWGRIAIANQLKDVIDSVEPDSAGHFSGVPERTIIESRLQHKTFYTHIKKQFVRKSALLDFGVGDGMLAETLVDMGYKVYAVAEIDDVDRVSKTLESRLPRGSVKVIPFDLGKQGVLDLKAALDKVAPVCCISQGVMQLSSDVDIIKLVDIQLGLAGRCIFSVPSDNYPGKYTMGGRVFSTENIYDLLRGYNATFSAYGVDNQYIYADVTGKD